MKRHFLILFAIAVFVTAFSNNRLRTNAQDCKGERQVRFSN